MGTIVPMRRRALLRFLHLGAHIAEDRHVLDLVPRDAIVLAQHGIHLLLECSQWSRVLRKAEDRPGEGCCGCLVASNEEGHKVVTELLASCVLSAHVHQETQQAWILDIVIVTGLQTCCITVGQLVES